MKNILVIIPAFNEERSVGSVVMGVLKNPGITKCVVVDDGSTDNTADVARKSGAHVLKNSRNIGTGASVAAGLRYAAQKGADIVVLMDADGQHDPKHIQQLLHSADKSTDLVVGSRYVCPTSISTPRIREVGTKAISLMFWLLYGVRVYDMTSGFRAANKKVIKYLAHNYPTTFSEPEIVLDLIAKKYSIKETPVNMRPRRYGKSSITLLKGLYLIIYFLIKALHRRLSMR